VWVLIEMIDAIGIEQRAPALNAMHFIPFFQQKLGQIGTILAGNSGYQSSLGHVALTISCSSFS